MYKIHLINVLFVLFLFEYSDSYKTYSVLDDNLCIANILSDQLLKLFNTNKNKPIILEESGYSSAIRLTDSWNADILKVGKKSCIFKVEARSPDKNTGIYAVIQKLNLRQDELTNKCIDYIKFKLSNKYYSDEICGTILPHINPVLTVEDRGGALKVEIFIDDKLLRYGEQLDLDIVFTRYQKCEITNPDFPYTTCKSKYNLSTCISSEFYKDDIYNCPEPYCGDEEGCLPEAIPNLPTNKKPSTSNIALSAIASLIFTMFIVTACIWLCWKYRECMNVCSSDTPPINSRTTRTTEPTSRNIRNAADASRETAQMMNVINEPARPRAPPPHIPANQPTAPTYEISSAPIEEKDLPPSYDSLFAAGDPRNR